MKQSVNNILSFRSIENPSSSMSNPANWLIELFGGKSIAGVNVSTETVIGLPAIWRGVNLFSGILGSLPLQVLSEVAGNKTNNREHPVYSLLHWKPNNLMTSFTWRQTVMATALLWGNGYSRIKWKSDARPYSITPLHPANVTPAIDGDNLVYVYDNGGVKEIITSTDMIHIKGLGFDGIKGRSIISVLRENLGSSLAVQEFGANYFGKGT